ncbi:MAG TPA: SDR family NAD(P)-dependent oxidoreductase [Longimicrobium sp.]|nr:SDR family NAD(P)-dependent oxidoreductase [Longimicrobium sp.]
MDVGLNLGLAGKRAVVSGASRGVGRATALMLARAGCDVGIGYLSREGEANGVADEVRRAGRKSFAQAGDIATPWGAELLFERALVEFGGIDVFVGNAGVWVPDDVAVADMTDEQWAQTLRANLESVFYTVRLAARFVAPNGRIVLVSSTAGQRGEAFHADYAASKGAMIALTKSVAVELAPRGITVNCVAPGWIDTEMVEKPMAGGRARIEASIPIGRIATADDVAGPIVFLCSQLARHVTGEILNVNGGSVLCG